MSRAQNPPRVSRLALVLVLTLCTFSGALTPGLAAPMPAGPLLAAPLVALPPTAPNPPGNADPSGNTAASLQTARTEAQRLRTTVNDLEVRAAMASQDEQEARAQWDQANRDEINATIAADKAEQASKYWRAKANGRIRALYRSGGESPLVASVFAGQTGVELGDVQTGLRTVRTLVETDRGVVESARRSAEDAKEATLALAKVRSAKQAANAKATFAHSQLVQALEGQQRALKAADATVTNLAAQLAREEEEARIAQARTLGRGGPSSLDATQLRQIAAQNPLVAPALNAAISRLGAPYVWGATGPDTFDCSGLMLWSYRANGVSLPRTSRQQFAQGVKVDLNQLQVGDLVYFGKGAGGIHHVGMFVGSGLMLHAPHTGDVVKVSGMWRDSLVGATRPLASG